MNMTLVRKPWTEQYFGCNKPYVPEEAHSNLKNYKYSGGDSSFSYNYFWSPLAEWSMQFIPMSMA
jgi:hypothetical protein